MEERITRGEHGCGRRHEFGHSGVVAVLQEYSARTPNTCGREPLNRRAAEDALDTGEGLSVREQLPVPKSKRGAQRAPEAPLRLWTIREHARLVVQQHAHAVRLAHQRHRHQLANTQEAALVPTQSSRGMPGLGHAHAELPRPLHRHLPVVAAGGDLLAASTTGPVAEALGVVLHVARVQAQHAVDDARVLLEEVQAAVGPDVHQLLLLLLLRSGATCRRGEDAHPPARPAGAQQDQGQRALSPSRLR
ncbi:hypothetical protein CRUP_024904 [Coryphaenoides rupestris]|nr:hypothetical protein CRUP_024904 [Coryphaenoides rupestris]